ncbi:MAG: type VI secretion system contractile sheath small subunit [Gammaproteobacteria bacterium]|nr:type VI secretion system contractile sheath small subunit [Gammaproteobacteria bacterium]
MAKEGSVAPKERINIKYSPSTGDSQEDVELPFKVMVMGDFTQQEDERPVEERKPININKDNFNEVLSKQNLTIDLNVSDKLSDEISGDEDSEMAINLEFNSLKDFEPESIVRQVPELNKLLELREALVALKGPLGNVPAFRKEIQSVLDDESKKQQLMSELDITSNS